MAFIFAEPWAGYSNTSETAKSGWAVPAGSYSISGGRFGYGYITASNSSNPIKRAIASSGKLIVMVCVKPTGTGPGTFLKLQNNGGSETCFSLAMTATYAVRVLNAAGTVIATTAANTLATARWNVIQIKVEIGATSGTVDMWINDMATPVYSASAINLKVSSAAAADELRLCANGADMLFSEMLVYDTSGSAPWNAVLGDKRLYLLQPASDDAAGWTRNTGSSNAAAVDDPLSESSDGDTTYVAAASEALTDRYVMTSLPELATGIAGVIIDVEARKSDAGAPPSDLKTTIDYSGTTADGAGISSLTTSYVRYQQLFADAPGGSGWTKAQVDVLKVGQMTAVGE
jgi:hypothetical protein